MAISFCKLVGKALAGQPQVFLLLGAEFFAGELLLVLDLAHAGLEAGLHHAVGHLVQGGDVRRQAGRRLLGIGELLQQPKRLVLVLRRPRLGQQGVEQLPGVAGAVLLRGIFQLCAEEGQMLLRAGVRREHAGQDLAKLMLDLPVRLGVPAAPQALGDLLPRLASRPAGSLEDIQFTSRWICANLSFFISLRRILAASRRTRRHSSVCWKY